MKIAVAFLATFFASLAFGSAVAGDDKNLTNVVGADEVIDGTDILLDSASKNSSSSVAALGHSDPSNPMIISNFIEFIFETKAKDSRLHTPEEKEFLSFVLLDSFHEVHSPKGVVDLDQAQVIFENPLPDDAFEDDSDSEDDPTNGAVDFLTNPGYRCRRRPIPRGCPGYKPTRDRNACIYRITDDDNWNPGARALRSYKNPCARFSGRLKKSCEERRDQDRPRGDDDAPGSAWRDWDGDKWRCEPCCRFIDQRGYPIYFKTKWVCRGVGCPLGGTMDDFGSFLTDFQKNEQDVVPQEDFTDEDLYDAHWLSVGATKTKRKTPHRLWEIKFCDMMRHGPYTVFHSAHQCQIHFTMASEFDMMEELASEAAVIMEE